VAKKLFNLEVKRYFAEVTSDELDLNTPRSSLRTACIHQETDNLSLTIGRILLFELTIRGGNSAANHVGPAPTHKVIRKGVPQLILFFLEDADDVDPEYRAVSGRISIRLMGETPKTLTRAGLLALGNRVKAEFGGGGGYIWKKGRTMLSYTSWEEGYQLQILCFSESDGRTLIGKILDLRNDTPDWSLSNLSENLEEGEAYPIVPPREMILGEQTRLPRARPRANVRFQSAWIESPGLPDRLFIYDRSGRHRSALIRD
jgi:hypothetical protein